MKIPSKLFAEYLWTFKGVKMKNIFFLALKVDFETLS